MGEKTKTTIFSLFFFFLFLLPWFVRARKRKRWRWRWGGTFSNCFFRASVCFCPFALSVAFTARASFPSCVPDSYLNNTEFLSPSLSPFFPPSLPPYNQQRPPPTSNNHYPPSKSVFQSLHRRNEGRSSARNRNSTLVKKISHLPTVEILPDCKTP